MDYSKGCYYVNLIPELKPIPKWKNFKTDVPTFPIQCKIERTKKRHSRFAKLVEMPHKTSSRNFRERLNTGGPDADVKHIFQICVNLIPEYNVAFSLTFLIRCYSAT